MTKIYDALRRAEHEQGRAKPPQAGLEPPGHHDPHRRALRQKLIAVHQTIDSQLPDMATRVVMFVAARAGEGCSVLVRELAKLASAELGQRVALIDATPAAGGHFEYFGVAPAGALETVGTGQAPLHDALQPVQDNPRLCLGCVATGETSASVVAGGHNFGDAIKALRGEFTLILIDVPPLAQSSDALVLAPQTDGVILVVEAEKTRWQVAESAREKLAMQGANLLGVILNKRQFYIPGFIYRRL